MLASLKRRSQSATRGRVKLRIETRAPEIFQASPHLLHRIPIAFLLPPNRGGTK